MTLRVAWAWVYHWLTVIGAIAFGGASLVLQKIDAIAYLDWGSWLPPQLALKIVTGVAATKMACTMIVFVHGMIVPKDDTP